MTNKTKMPPMVINGRTFNFEKQEKEANYGLGGAELNFYTTKYTWRSGDGRIFDKYVDPYQIANHYSIFTQADDQELKRLLEKAGVEFSYFISNPLKAAKLKAPEWEDFYSGRPDIINRRIRSCWKNRNDRRFQIYAEGDERGLNLGITSEESADPLIAWYHGGRTKPNTLGKVAEYLLIAIQKK